MLQGHLYANLIYDLDLYVVHQCCEYGDLIFNLLASYCVNAEMASVMSVTLGNASRSSIFELDLELYVVHQCCEYSD